MADTITVKDKDIEIKVRDNKKIRAELAELVNENGLLTADAVATKAADPESALHKAGPFHWESDEKAAHQWRLTVARAIIRKLNVVMPNDGSETVMPKYISLRQDRRREGGGYRETSQVMNNAELLAELEETASKDIEGVLRRYEMLKDFVKRVRSAIGKAA